MEREKEEVKRQKKQIRRVAITSSIMYHQTCIIDQSTLYGQAVESIALLLKPLC